MTKTSDGSSASSARKVLDDEQVTISTDNQIRRHVEWADTRLDRAIVHVIDTGGRRDPCGADGPQPSSAAS